MKSNPFSSAYDLEDDLLLIADARNGSKPALENLIRKHQAYIYNVAHKMVLDPTDAEDLTQEALIKIVTNLAKFNGQSSFRTWAYRIVVNHFLNARKKRVEQIVSTFSAFGRSLDETPDHELTPEELVSRADQVTEARTGCLSAMLLCFDREQRLIYVLGEIFQIDHETGAPLFAISKENYRQKLSRARKELNAFINHKCGLINRDNPCRCHKKTKAFIQRGWVDPENLQFADSRLKKIREVTKNREEEIAEAVDLEYANLYRQHPFQEKEYVSTIRRSILENPRIQEIFHFEE